MIRTRPDPRIHGSRIRRETAEVGGASAGPSVPVRMPGFAQPGGVSDPRDVCRALPAPRGSPRAPGAQAPGRHRGHCPGAVRLPCGPLWRLVGPCEALRPPCGPPLRPGALCGRAGGRRGPEGRRAGPVSAPCGSTGAGRRAARHPMPARHLMPARRRGGLGKPRRLSGGRRRTGQAPGADPGDRPGRGRGAWSGALTCTCSPAPAARHRPRGAGPTGGRPPGVRRASPAGARPRRCSARRRTPGP